MLLDVAWGVDAWFAADFCEYQLPADSCRTATSAGYVRPEAADEDSDWFPLVGWPERGWPERGWPEGLWVALVVEA